MHIISIKKKKLKKTRRETSEPKAGSFTSQKLHMCREIPEGRRQEKKDRRGQEAAGGATPTDLITPLLPESRP